MGGGQDGPQEKFSPGWVVVNVWPHYPRLYTIATSRYGDHCDGQTTSLCVKKIAWWDQQVGGLKKELCSRAGMGRFVPTCELCSRVRLACASARFR